ncbi:MAG: glycosyltransferase [Defluviitaleaceae bacterium]|nr:glycosyltransferase [Defluviitaleaceae bacterium]
MSSPLISIVMPCYNAEKYVESAVKSVMAQTYRNWELLIVNDCSADGSAAIVRRYAQSDCRVKYFDNAVNSGVAASRNKGVAQADGDYVAFLDADDIWQPSKLERQVAFMLEKGCAISYTAHGFIDEDGRTCGRVYYPPGEVDYNRFLRSNVMCASSVMTDARIMKSTGFSGDVFHEDFTAWLAIVKAHGSGRGIAEPLTMYRVIRGSKSDNKLVSARGVYNIYRRHLRLGALTSLWCMLFYTYNGLKKYSLRKS